MLINAYTARTSFAPLQQTDEEILGNAVSHGGKEGVNGELFLLYKLELILNCFYNPTWNLNIARERKTKRVEETEIE